ncbi:MAG: hypothetical protein MI861_16215, partial [Pirellulales bacterium]|nr:hypothetical protein [Pirellulales bacterium]
MTKITGNETFNQLYGKLENQLRPEGRLQRGQIAGKRAVIVRDGTLGTQRFRRMQSKSNGSKAVFQAMVNEYGEDTAERVFSSVTGHDSGQNKKVTLDQMRKLRNELEYESPLSLNADGSRQPGLTFSKVKRQISEEQGLDNHPINKHIRFKPGKGLYFHENGNLFSFESKRRKREAAGGRIWQSLVNEYSEAVANKVFTSLFGDGFRRDNQNRPQVAVTLKRFSEISSEIKKIFQDAVTEPILKHMYNRVGYIDTQSSKDDDTALREYLKNGEILKQKYLQDRDDFDDIIIKCGTDSDLKHAEKMEDYLHDTLPPSNAPAGPDWLSEKQNPGNVNNVKNNDWQTATEYQQLVWKVYQNTDEALRVLGDVLFVLENSTNSQVNPQSKRQANSQFKLTPERRTVIENLKMAALDALGIGRWDNEAGKFVRDAAITDQQEKDIKTLAKIMSTVKAAQATDTQLSEEAISVLQHDLAGLRRRLESSLKNNERHLTQQQQFFKDLRKLKTGDNRLQGVSMFKNDEPQKGPGKGSKPPENPNVPEKETDNSRMKIDNPNLLKRWDVDDKNPTPLQAWHESRVELNKVESMIDILEDTNRNKISRELKNAQRNAKRELLAQKKKLKNKNLTETE